jgi:hypothetical protein
MGTNRVDSGRLPSGVGNSIRIDSDQFDSLLRAGKLYRLRSRKAEERARSSRQAAAALGLSEDQHTTKLDKGQYQHRFINDSGAVSTDHPYSSTPDERAR